MKQSKMRKKKMLISMLMAMVLVFGCFGCSSSKKNTISVEDAKKTVVMTIDDYDVTLSEYNMFLMQYLAMQGTNPDDLTDEKITSLQSQVASEMKLEIVEYLLAKTMDDIELDDDAKSEIDTNTDKYLKQFGEDFLKQYGVDKEAVKQLFTEQAYIKALTDKAKQDLADQKYEENAEKFKDIKFHTVYYALFPSVQYKDGEAVTDDDGNNVDLSAEEMKEQKKKAEELQKRAANGEKLEDLIKEYDIEASSGEERNYDGAYSDELNKVLEDMKEGDISEVVETDAGYMVVRMDNPDDTDYKEYALHYAAMQSVQTQIGTLQQSWVKEAGCESLEPDADAIAKIDIKELCKQMKENGIYE